MIIMLLWLIYPDICHVIFSSLSCIEKEGVQRLYRDLETICWKTEHLRFIMFITVPGLIFWVIGLPAFLFYCIYSNKEYLVDLDNTKDYSRYD